MPSAALEIFARSANLGNSSTATPVKVYQVFLLRLQMISTDSVVYCLSLCIIITIQL